jgi:N-acetylmuramoyl-L-alanine amidase
VEGETYKEFGYEAKDNFDGDITEKVEVEGDVKTAIGTYKINYIVEDSSGNKASAVRTVVVNKKLVAQQAPAEKKEQPKNITATAVNEITRMRFTSTGIDVSVKYSTTVDAFVLVNTSTGNEAKFPARKSDSIYSASMTLTEFVNGTFDLFLESAGSRVKVTNKLDFIERINRAKVGSKLVTVSYNNNNVSITTSSHAYQYDIVIDVGHGGSDPGAINSHMYESTLNLEVSLYERDRYMEHGLTVLLNRTGTALNLTMGPSDLPELRRRAYAIGYHGAVARFVYSNHHNSSTNTSLKGYEVIVPATSTTAQLTPEHATARAWDNIFTLGDNRMRFYTRDFDTEAHHNKRGGQVYTFNNHYAMNRIPYNLFNVICTIYEGCYISNSAEFQWYYSQGNWRKVSEAKIKAYVEALGKAYIPPANN